MLLKSELQIIKTQNHSAAVQRSVLQEITLMTRSSLALTVQGYDRIIAYDLLRAGSRSAEVGVATS